MIEAVMEAAAATTGDLSAVALSEVEGAKAEAIHI